MGDPYSGRIYDLAEGLLPKAGHVGLDFEQAEQLKQMPQEERIPILQEMARQQAIKSTRVFSVEQVAKIIYAANAALCNSIGDHSQSSWDEAPDWQRETIFKGVLFHLQNHAATPEGSHESWLKEKAEKGWVYGDVKDPDATPPTHPCIMPYDQLPPEQQAKDHLFKAIVRALAPFIQ